MTIDPQTLAEHIRQLGEHERKVIVHLLQRKVSVSNTNTVFDASLTFGQRLADQVAAFGGSWTFILLFFGVMVVWILLNVAAGRTFDPYPFILLNLVLSMLAALQAPVIMMSQNRQAARDRLDAQHDYEVNLKAEMEIMALHTKMDVLRQAQWDELIRLQRAQLDLLQELQHGSHGQKTE
jgi:uncharacterized membrane protein